MVNANYEKRCEHCGALVFEHDDGFCKNCGEFFDEIKTRWFNNGPDEIHICEPH